MTHTKPRNLLGSLVTLGIVVGAATAFTTSTAAAAPPWSGLVQALIINTVKNPVPVQNVVLPVPLNQQGSFSIDNTTTAIGELELPRPAAFPVSVAHVEEIELMVFSTEATPVCSMFIPGTVAPEFVQYDLRFEARRSGLYVGRLGTPLTLPAGAEISFWCSPAEGGHAVYSIAGRFEGFREVGP